MDKQTRGFGVPEGDLVHHFIVDIPRTPGSITISEDLGMCKKGELLIIEKTTLSRAAWDEIAAPVQRLFNERLQRHGLKSGRWKMGANPVDRLLGKELALLALALDNAPSSCHKATLRNWASYRPEERWFIYQECTDPRTGAGWIKSLKYSLGGLC